MINRPINKETDKRTAALAVPVITMVIPMAVMLVIGCWGLDRGGIWRDEAATFQVARRTVPQIWRLLHEVDAVHGLYYLLMRPVLALHPGEVLLRLPSVLAAAATAGLVAALGTRLARPRVGLWAGLLYAVNPMVGHYAQEGRSYAMVAAGAAAATLLLVRAAVEGRSWTPYAAVLAGTCLLHEFAVLLLLAHAVTLALTGVARRVWAGWLCAAGVVALVLLPLALLSHAQSAQVSWLRSPGLGSVDRLVHQFAGPTDEILVPCLLLMYVALRRPRTTCHGREPTLAAVALPLLLVPPATLMTVSQWSPLYDDRYVLYALAGAPLLAAAGADRIARAVPRLPRMTVTAAGVLAVAVVCAHQLPLLRQDRSVTERGDNLAAASALAARELRPGDPVLFLPSIGRRSALAYPKGFRAARDVALAESARASGTLYGVEVGPDALRRQLAGLDHVWLVAEPYALDPSWRPASPTEQVKRAVVDKEFEPRREYTGSGVTLRLYERRPTTAPR